MLFDACLIPKHKKKMEKKPDPDYLFSSNGLVTLRYIMKNPGCTILEMSKQSKIPAASLYRIVSELEQNGLVYKKMIFRKDSEHRYGIYFATVKKIRLTLDASRFDVSCVPLQLEKY